MALRFFTVPILDSGESEAEINAFLASHRVLTVERKWVDLGVNSLWAICVDYVPAGHTVNRAMKPNLGRNRIDYKNVLGPEEFGVFSRLRELRKAIAQEEAKPVYALFTNEQLAQFVQRRCQTMADLRAVEGVGEARIDRYGERFLSVLSTSQEVKDATSGESV